MQKIGGVSLTTRDINLTAAVGSLREYIPQLVRDETGEAWVQFRDRGLLRFALAEGTEFCDWLRVSLHAMTGSPRESWVEPIAKLFAAEARRQQPRTLHLRTANIQDAWFFDLSERQTLILKPGSLELTEPAPIFRRYPQQDALEADLSANIADLDRLRRYLAFADALEADLFLSTLPAYLVPGIARPVQLARGPPGSAKSTIGAITKAVLDPQRGGYRGGPLPRDDRDWFGIARRHSIVFCDNLASLSRQQQDEICRSVTGRTVEQRKLYTTSEITTATIKPGIILNAIDLSGLASDFLDRTFIWELARIPDEQRIPEEQLWHDLRRDLPLIRGALFRILAHARELINQVEQPGDLRLQDFALWAAACAAARGQTPEVFARELRLKAELQRDETIAQSNLTGPLGRFMASRESWEGSAEELLQELTKQEYSEIIGEGVHERTVVRNPPKTWYRDPRSLGKELSRTEFLLPHMGFRLVRKQAHRGRRVLRLETFAESHASNASEPPGSLNSWVTAPENDHKSPEISCLPHASMPPPEPETEARNKTEARTPKSHASGKSAPKPRIRASERTEARDTKDSPKVTREDIE